jgi:hypothetical protein
LEPVYVAVTAHDQFCAFSRTGDKIHVYLPHDLEHRHRTIDFNEWLKLAASYHQPNDLHLYDDVVNAVWQELSFRNLLNKKEVKILKTELGKFYPRIWRGLYVPKKMLRYNPVNPRSMYGSTYIRSNVAATSLYDYLQDLFKYVEPAIVNLDVFGNKLRELLILTCTEVEASWRAVLEENSSKKKSRYKTNDYIKVKEPLRLDEWSVELRDYPDLGTFSPFKPWHATNPTKSLPWYEGYNAVKHHRGVEYAQASLRNLINAVAAVHVLQAAQWGPEMYDRMFGNLRSPFMTTQFPTFALSDLYVPTLDGQAALASTRFFDRHT